MAKGYIYVMTNPSFKEYVKIGWADDVEKRKRELDGSTAVPFSFKIFATLEVSDQGSKRSDVFVHNLIEMLRPELRSVEKNETGKIIRKREFFQMEAEEAYELLEQISGLTGGRLLKYAETQKEKAEAKVAAETKSRFDQTLAARYAYWTDLMGLASEDSEYMKVLSVRKPSHDHWLDVGCGVGSGHIAFTINVRQNGIGVEFYIPKNKKLYSKLESRKDEIERELGFELDWQPLIGKDACRIIVRNELGDYRKLDAKDRQQSFQWMIKTATAMGRIFKKYASAQH